MNCHLAAKANKVVELDFNTKKAKKFPYLVNCASIPFHCIKLAKGQLAIAISQPIDHRPGAIGDVSSSEDVHLLRSEYPVLNNENNVTKWNNVLTQKSPYLIINVIIAKVSRWILRLKAPVDDDILKKRLFVFSGTFKLKEKEKNVKLENVQQKQNFLLTSSTRAAFCSSLARSSGVFPVAFFSV